MGWSTGTFRLAGAATLALVGLVNLAACTEPNPAGRADGGPLADACTPGAWCEGDTAVSCSAEGELQRTECSEGCKEGKCLGSCANKTFFPDLDGDGHGDPLGAISACDPPAGYVQVGGDCDDKDPSAHPGQLQYFTVPTKGTMSFDYDCDKLEQQAYPALASCTLSGGKCVGDGWQTAVPACGQQGKLVTCHRQSGGQGCAQTVASAVQGCH